jgi:Domain of unknown function (DUF4253)
MNGFFGIFAGMFGADRAFSSDKIANLPLTTPSTGRVKLDEEREQLLKALPYRRIEVSGERAFEEWQRIRDEGTAWPVIVGDDDQLFAIAEQFSSAVETMPPPSLGKSTAQSGDERTTPAAIIAEAAKLKIPQSLKQWSEVEGGLPEPPLGEWPSAKGGKYAQLTVASDDLTGKPFARVHILIIPTTNSWEVPAYLGWGNWNACPPPTYHVAVLKSWNQRFGAELVGINADTLNIRISRPPTDRKTALDLARQQYLYCPDLIDQGVGNLSALAAILMSGDWWYFWWD